MVYLIHACEGNYYKIGVTENIENRIKGLQTGNPEKLICEYIIEGNIEEEKRLHEKFAEYKKEGEWFEFNKRIKAKVVKEMKLLGEKHHSQDTLAYEGKKQQLLDELNNKDEVLYHLASPQKLLVLALMEFELHEYKNVKNRICEYLSIINPELQIYLESGCNFSVFKPKEKVDDWVYDYPYSNKSKYPKKGYKQPNQYTYKD